MPDYAVVIGIDAYKRPDWQLRAAVADARKFARWVTEPGSGRATPETTDLLLSPRPDDDGEDPFASVRATEAAIKAVYAKLAVGDGVAGDRLWFYYAGHAVMPQGAGPGTPPVLMPEDVEDLEGYLFLGPAELSKLLAKLQVRPPATQLFFIDACRGLVQTEEAAFATSQIVFDLLKVPGAHKATSRQALLCGATAGELANEKGAHGLFSKALLEGLRARGPELQPDFDRQDLVLTFDAVTRYTQARVRQLAEDKRPGGGALPAQEPWPSLLGLTGSEPLARFANAPTARLMMEVEPSKARREATAGIRTWMPHAGKFELVQPRPAPLPEIVQWELPLGDHRVEVEAEGYAKWHRTVTLRDDDSLHARLISDDDTTRNGGLESIRPTLPAAEGTGRLVVKGGDSLARIEVFDDANARVGAGWERLALAGLPVGPYRIDVSWPGLATQTYREVVWGNRATVIDAEPRGVAIPSALEAPLAERGFSPDGAFTSPSEDLGRSLTTRVGELLTWAAVAGWSGAGQRLRLLRVLPPDDPQPDGCYVHVLLADVGTSGHGSDPSPLPAVIRHGETDVAPTPIRSLPEHARQAVVTVTDASAMLELVAPDLSLRLDVPRLPGWVWIVAIARETEGQLAITRHLHRVGGALSPLVRHSLANAAALAANAALLDDEVDRIRAQDPDPLTRVVLGYRLARAGELGGFEADVDDLLETMPDVADVHVLRALLAGDDADAVNDAMTAAQACGRPLVHDGYQRMLAWTTEQAARRGLPPPLEQMPALGGQGWTVQDARSRSAFSPASPAIDVARLHELRPAWAEGALRAATATARIEHPAGGYGSGFVVEGGVVITAGFVVEGPVGSLDSAPRRLSFDDDGAGEHPLVEILARTEGASGLVRLRYEGPEVAGLTVATTQPQIGQRIGVLGFPAVDPRVPIDAIERAFGALPVGHKMLTPGVITEIEDDTLRYDGWTLGGAAGGPVIDLATGELLGVHLGGKYDADRQVKTGFGVRYEP